MAKGTNFNTDIVRFTMGSAGVEAAITHNLGRVPEDAFICDIQGDPTVSVGNLFRGPTAWTSSQVFFESGVTGVFYAMMLI